MRAIRWTLAILIVASGVPQARAGTIYTDFGSWQAAVGGFQTETFNSFGETTFPDYHPFTNQGVLDAGNVTIEVSGLGTFNRLQAPSTSGNFQNFNTDGTTFAFLETLTKSSGGQVVSSLVFDAPVRAFAADWKKTFGLADPLYGADASFSIDGQSFSFRDYMSGPSGDGFLGFVSETAFTRIDFGTGTATPAPGYSTVSALFGMDNLRFALAPAIVPIVNATFDIGSSIGEMGDAWTVSGPGSATIVEDPLAEDSGDGVAKLTTGSPITISQVVETLSGTFTVAFDYLFQTTTGVLEVYLDDVLIASLTAPSTLEDHWSRYQVLVNDPSLFDLSGVPLEFRFDGVTGSEVLIDDVSITSSPTVPEPGTLALMCLGGIGLVSQSVRRKRKQRAA